MKRALVLFLSLGCLAFAGTFTEVFPSVAPNSYGSPSYPTYVQNAIYALMNGLPAYGNPNARKLERDCAFDRRRNVFHHA
ncbi:MAG TPA: hypothetical protein VMG35_25740 [Bryobacteraceae bacterium]|nr:hypothetical protein [Bryobacteraceae bacterium]